MPQPPVRPTTRRLTAVAALTALAAAATVSTAAPATALTGGPDSGGYTFTDSTEAGGPAAGPFTDISSTGTDVGNHCDDCVTSDVALPFRVALYGTSYSSANVSSNGNIQFTTADNDLTTSWPLSFGPAVGAFQTDLRTDRAGGGVLIQSSGTSPHRALTVQWNTVRFSDESVPEVFQAVFTEGSTQIQLRYLDVGGNGAAGIQGAENGANGLALRYGGTPTDNLAVAFDTTTNTTVNLVSKPTTIVYGQKVTLTATVRRSDGNTGVPTGTVTFYGDTSGTAVGTATLNSSGVAVLNTTKLPAYTSSVYAVYGGSGTATAATSVPVAVSVSAANTTTTVKPATGSAIAFGTAVTAKVAAVKPGAGTPTGTVDWYVDGDYVDSTTLKSGSGTLPAADLPPGSHTVRADFSCDTDNYNSSASSTVSYTVSKASTTTTLAQSPASPAVGQKVTLTATVKDGVASVTPTGTVSFYDNGDLLGTVALSSKATASYVIASYTPRTGGGSVRFTAVYSGDTNFAGSSSPS